MKSYHELKAEFEKIVKVIAAEMKHEQTESLKTAERLCKGIGFTNELLKGALAEGKSKL